MPTIQQLQQQIYYLQLRLERLNHAVCCASTGIPFVTTEDSATVTFSGTGTVDDPLSAEAVGGPTNPSNLLIAATDASGNIIDGTSNVISRTLTGFTTGANSTIVAGDTILGALQKAQGQIDARVSLASALTGYTAGANTALAATDTILAAFGKVQGQLNAKINNQATVQAGAVYNVVRGIITQASGGTVATQFPANQVDAFTVTGGKGASTTFAGTTTAAKGGQINITSGAGGDLSASATGGNAGSGGQVRLLGGNGGNAVSAGTSAGDGGLVEIQGGDAGVSSGGATVGNAGYVSIKAGNAAITGNADGGNVYIIAGLNNGTGRVGGIFMGLSPSNQRRGTVFVGCLQGDSVSAASTDMLYVKGQAKFVDTPVKGVDAINTDEFVTRGQLTQNGNTASRPASPITGQMYFDTSLVPAKPIWYNGTTWVDATGTAA